MDDKPIAQTQRFEFIQHQNVHALVIHDVTLQETAEYSIEAGGVRFTVARLIVDGASNAYEFYLSS